MAEVKILELVAERADKDTFAAGGPSQSVGGAAEAQTQAAASSASSGTTSGGTGSGTGSGTGQGSGSDTGSSSDIFEFDQSNLDAVYSSEDGSITTGFKKPEAVTLTSLSWLALASNNSYVPLTNLTILSKDTSPENALLYIFYDNSTIKLDFTAATKQWYTTFPSEMKMDVPMKLQALWYNGNVHGNSSSAEFAVYDESASLGPVATSKYNADRTAAGFSGTSVLATVTASDDSQAAAGTASSSSSTASSSGKSSSSSKGGGSGGLSTGATAGIAVGCVIGGLIIIAVLAWFLLRRRRQKNVVRSLQPEQSNAYMVDKETHNRATDSPNSPYSDENQVQQVPLTDLGTTTRDAPVVAYHDTPGRASSSGSHGGAQTPQGMNSNVAHLVEEGMTEDEIRRLEEEERQLDDAIERAARR